MSSLEHFSHEHPLILKEEWDTDTNSREESKILCYGCGSPIIPGSDAGDVYSCSSNSTSGGDTCHDFYLHKRCAELSKQIQHPMHDIDNHPLTLCSRAPYNSESCSCNACSRTWKWFTYNCLSCEFDLCLTCAFEGREFHHVGHQHALTLMQREALFKCDACGKEDKDSSYSCDSCQFWMHKTCALAPPITVEPKFHRHPLVLIYSLPDMHRHFPQYCRICEYKLHPNYWLYYCHECTFCAHMKCVMSSVDISLSVDKKGHVQDEPRKEIDIYNLTQFPAISKEASIDLIIDLFTKGVNINCKKRRAKASEYILALKRWSRRDRAEAGNYPLKINHWSHKDHTLMLLEQVETSKNDDQTLICNACIKPISATYSFYACMKCNYFLHKFCFDLPGMLPVGVYSIHPKHPLHLFHISDKYSFVKCASCGLLTNGFYYRCKKCDIRFDINCCFLPNKMKHKSHKHPLVKSGPSGSPCFACNWIWTDSDIFECENTSCRFSCRIHTKCLSLPSTIRHRWDPHPISLIYPPFDYEGVIYCEICEELVNANYWFYHCRECDQSFHTECLRPLHNVKVGDRVDVDVALHPHTMTLVYKRRNDYCHPLECCNCHNKDLDKFTPLFECANCDIVACVVCVSSNLKPLAPVADIIQPVLDTI